MTTTEPVVEVSDVTKQYGALRPLRIARLQVLAGEQVAIVGLDQPAAEVFISLLTGAGLPDSGSVHVFGRATRIGHRCCSRDRRGALRHRRAGG